MKQTYTIRMETKLHDMLMKISKKRWKTFSQIISDAVSGYAQDVPSVLDAMNSPEDSRNTPEDLHNIPQDVEKPKQLY